MINFTEEKFPNAPSNSFEFTWETVQKIVKSEVFSDASEFNLSSDLEPPAPVYFLDLNESFTIKQGYKNFLRSWNGEEMS